MPAVLTSPPARAQLVFRRLPTVCPPRVSSRVEALTVAASYPGIFAILGARWLVEADTSVPLTPPALNIQPDAKLIVWILHWVAYALRHAPANLFEMPIY